MACHGGVSHGEGGDVGWGGVPWEADADGLVGKGAKAHGFEDMTAGDLAAAAGGAGADLDAGEV